MRSLRWSCRRSLDSLSSRSTVSDNRLLWSSFIFSRWRTCTASPPGTWRPHALSQGPAPGAAHPPHPPSCAPVPFSTLGGGSLWLSRPPPPTPRWLCPRPGPSPAPTSSQPHPQTTMGGCGGPEKAHEAQQGPHPGQLLVLLLQPALQLPKVLLHVAMPFFSLGVGGQVTVGAVCRPPGLLLGSYPMHPGSRVVSGARLSGTSEAQPSPATLEQDCHHQAAPPELCRPLRLPCALPLRAWPRTSSETAFSALLGKSPRGSMATLLVDGPAAECMGSS